MPNDFVERTVEDIIFNNRNVIHNYGLPKFKSKVFKQFYLPSGKKIDILAYDLINGHIHVDIYELKRFVINTDAVAQAYNYLVEFSALAAMNFKSVDINIIMVGNRYEPVPIFEKMNLPFSVYVYEYSIDGMRFNCCQQKKQLYLPNEEFCMGLWAFGIGRLSFPNGQDNTVNFVDIIRRIKHLNPKTYEEIEFVKQETLHQKRIEKVIEKEFVECRPKSVKTIIFPEQPVWSKEFASGIPHNDLMEDIEQDLSDYEPDSDFEKDSDFEPDYDNEDGDVDEDGFNEL